MVISRVFKSYQDNNDEDKRKEERRKKKKGTFSLGMLDLTPLLVFSLVVIKYDLF